MLIDKIRQLIEMSKTHNWFYDAYIKDRASVTAFQQDTNIRKLPLFDLSHLTSAASLLSGCSNLEEVPLFDLSNCTSFYYTFSGLTKITTIPLINTSNGTSFNYTFNGCTALETIPQIDTSQGTNFANMFYGCIALKEVPVLNTSKGTSFSGMFRNCSALETIHGLDVSNATSLNNMFASCSELRNYTPVGTIGTNFNMQYQHNLTVDSAKKIICALVNYLGTEKEYTYRLYFSTTVWDLLDAEGEEASPDGGTWREYVQSLGWNI